MAWIYIDILFFISWSMDTFLLWMAGRIVGFRAKGWRLVLGGMLTAVFYCGWMLSFRNNGGLLVSFVLLSIGIEVGYTPKTAKIFLRLCGGSLIASFLLGGGIQVLFTMTQAQRYLGHGLVTQFICPWYLLPWAVLVSYFALKLAARWLEVNIQRRREFCTVSVYWRGRQADGRVLIDTGNGMKQADGRGVVILELAALLPLFTAEEYVWLLAGEWERIAELEMLPFGSLGNADGKLWGICAEEVRLYFGEKEKIHKNSFVGISKEGFSGAYEGLTSPCLLEEERA